MFSGGERVETFKVKKDSNNKITIEYLHATIMDPKFNGITNDLVFLNQNRFIITEW